MRLSRSLALMMIAMLMVAGCGAFGAKQAATPGEQKLLDVGDALKTVSADYVKTNAKYVAQCPPRGTVLDSATCDAWTRYTAEFVREYEQADGDWRAGDAVKADVRVQLLKTKLATYASKTK